MSQEQKKPKNQSRGGRRLDGQTAENREKRSGGTAAAVREEEQQMSRRSAAARREAEPADVLTRCTRRVVRWLRRVRLRMHMIVREQKARNFPESDRLPVQLALLLWNMIPMWASLFWEHTWGRRKQFFRRGAAMFSRMEHRRGHPVVFLAGACMLAVLILLGSTYTRGTTVTYDGDVVGVVDSEATAQAIVSNLETVTTRTLGRSYKIDGDLVQYSTGWLKRQEVEDRAVVEEDLSEEIGLVTPAYCLYVDGERIGATPYEGALEELLEQLQQAATTEETISCSFKEEVEIKQEYVAAE